MGQYHDTLGVSPNDSDSAIKKAYKKLSGKFHPDKATSNGWSDEETAENEAEYKKINEAYQNLKKGVHDPQDHSAGFRQNGNPFGNMDAVINNMLIAQHVKNMAISHILQVEMRGSQCFQALGIPLKTLLVGGDFNVDTVYPILSGNQMSMKRHTETIKLEKNTPIETQIECSGVPITLILVPINTGEIPLQIDGLDIIVELEVGVIDALLGRDVIYNHIDSTKIKIKIPDNAKSGKLIRIPNKGLSHITGQQGHLFLSVSLIMPNLTSTQVETLTKTCKDLGI